MENHGRSYSPKVVRQRRRASANPFASGKSLRLPSGDAMARAMSIAPAHTEERCGRAILCRLGAATGFAVMAMLIKLGVDAGITTVELMFWRFAVGLAPLFAFVAWRSGPRTFATRHFPAQLLRAGIGLGSMYLSFQALRLLPLAEATTIGFAAPLFAIALSALLLREHVGPRRWSAVAVGFVGVVLVAAPGGTSLPLAGFGYAVSGALGVAAVTIAIRRLGRTEPPETTVFWFSMLSLPVLAAFLPADALRNDAAQWAILVAIGLSGGIAQLLMTSSLGLARISVVAPFDYSQIVWAMLFGWSIWDTVPGLRTLAGAAIIIACGLYSAYREHRLQRAAEATRSTIPVI